MNGGRDGRKKRSLWRDYRNEEEYGSQLVFGGFWVLLLIGTILVAGPWAGFHGILLVATGLLMLVRPPVFSLPRTWWFLAAAFAIAGAAPFLPARYFVIPEWRHQLELLGVETGSHIAIQSQQVAETLSLFAIMLFTGLWLAGHRTSSAQLRQWALAFTLGVACYAIIARAMQSPSETGQAEAGELYGFFPNRNHTATYLSMGIICGLGNVLQAIRGKRFFTMALALAGTGVCLWAVIGWSVSRAGVVLVAVGSIGWVAMLGRRYIGSQGGRLIALIFLAVTGLFFTADYAVKTRFSKTLEDSNAITGLAGATPGKGEKPPVESANDLDFRIPTLLDTLELIRDYKWTGIGAAQYYYIFPQYRKRTSVANDMDAFHPESDWLWMAAEAGVPATLALAALVVLAFRQSYAAIRTGKDRALRSACLIAALLVPFHGLFDVPGHRITLAWSAAFLYALSLHAPPPGSTSARPPKKWPFRLAALALLAVATMLIRAQWWNDPQPATTAAKNALKEARQLHDEDQALQQAAAAKGLPYQPEPADDKLEKALRILQQAERVAPLDRELMRYQGYLALYFDDKYKLADRCYAIDRTLGPTCVGCPLRQAEAWALIDPQRCAALWTIALERAAKLDQLHPGNDWSYKRTLERIRQFAAGKPALEKLVPAAK